MCGIGGILTLQAQAFPHSVLGTMSEALRHRGPDDYGVLQWNGVDPARRGRATDSSATLLGLVHRRLSIIDLSEGGWQPMSSRDGRFDVIFNGEIYNYIELRKEFEADGERFRSNSDTEILLAAWAKWGAGALARLVGMYAFVVVDWRERRLILVRDCFGIKPLYYTAWSEGFAFASEIKALLPLTSRRVAAQPLYNYLTYGLTDLGGETLFAEVQQVPPATMIEIDLDRAQVLTQRRYWQLPATAGSELSFEQAAEKLRALLIDNVRLHLRSDVPLGACLSGGIDSSAIVAIMRAVGGKDLDLHTFTYVADGAAINEERWADLAGSAAGATMHKILLRPGELVRDLDKLVSDQDLPFGSTSIYAQHRVFGAAREAGIKVMLDGQGADEMFAGYPFYAGARIASLLRGGNLRAAFSLSAGAARLPGENATRTWLRALAGFFPAPVSELASHLSGWNTKRQMGLNHRWFTERKAGADNSFFAHRSSLRDALTATFSSTNLPALLRYEDRNSMAHSIESRVPFLTRSLVEFVFSLPEHFLISADGSGKSVLRAALRGLVPDAILDRRDKIGFQTPEGPWLCELGGWVTKLLGSDAARAIPVFQAETALAEFQAICDGRQCFTPQIWRWLNLVRWSEQTNARFH